MVVTTEEGRCFQDESVYNPKTGKCRRCSSCGYGKGRNFSNHKTIEKRSKKCPPCRPCADGYFNNDLSWATCRRCVVDCTERYRHVTLECTRLHDAACGSCLQGYTEVYHNTDLPCSRRPTKVSSISTHKTPITTAKANLTVSATQKPTRYQSTSSIAVKQVNPWVVRPEHQEQPRIIGATALLGVFIFFLMVLIALIHIKKRRQLMSCTLDGKKKFDITDANIFHSNRYTPVIAEVEENDVEMDAILSVESSNTQGPHPELSTMTVPHTQGPHPELSTMTVPHTQGPHPELSTMTVPHIQGPHPELSTMTVPHTQGPHPELSTMTVPHTQGPNPELSAMTVPQVRTVPDSLIGIRQPFHYQRCSCTSVKDKSLCHFSTCNDAPIEKGSNILYKVASKICHNPTFLYQKLKIPNADIFLIDDDRNRDPTRISEKENILKIMNRWVEIHNVNASLKRLCIALCESGFHHIHVDILQQK